MTCKIIGYEEKKWEKKDGNGKVVNTYVNRYIHCIAHVVRDGMHGNYAVRIELDYDVDFDFDACRNSYYHLCTYYDVQRKVRKCNGIFPAEDFGGVDIE